MQTLADAGEHEVIGEIVAAAPSALNGDDAAVLFPAPPNSRTVASTDTMVEGRHFKREWSRPEEIGKKAITQNFADIEAMGARPVAALLAMSAPSDTPVAFVRGVAEGIAARCGDYTAELVGGDLTRSEEIVVTVTAIGALGGSMPALALTRARAGQSIVAHGRLGWSAAGLDLLRAFGRELPAGHERLGALIDQHCVPWLSPGRGVIARATGATAATDNSDGLVPDLGIFARRSGVRMDLNADAIAPDELLEEAGVLLGIDPWKWVLSGGEDHTLLVTTAKDAPSGFRPIGRVLKGEGVTLDGKLAEYEEGWVSF